MENKENYKMKKKYKNKNKIKIIRLLYFLMNLILIRMFLA
jgi:hypothetical protein